MPEEDLFCIKINEEDYHVFLSTTYYENDEITVKSSNKTVLTVEKVTEEERSLFEKSSAKALIYAIASQVVCIWLRGYALGSRGPPRSGSSACARYPNNRSPVPSVPPYLWLYCRGNGYLPFPWCRP